MKTPATYKNWYRVEVFLVNGDALSDFRVHNLAFTLGSCFRWDACFQKTCTIPWTAVVHAREGIFEPYLAFNQLQCLAKDFLEFKNLAGQANFVWIRSGLEGSVRRPVMRTQCSCGNSWLHGAWWLTRGWQLAFIISLKRLAYLIFTVTLTVMSILWVWCKRFLNPVSIEHIMINY